jgi:hypothetical protein
MEMAQLLQHWLLLVPMNLVQMGLPSLSDLQDLLVLLDWRSLPWDLEVRHRQPPLLAAQLLAD